MKLLDKYLFGQIFLSFIFGVILVMIVWIAPELLPKIVREVFTHKITALNGFLIILYELPEVIVKSVPMGVLIGTLLVFDRLSKDSEITAMRACGISIYRMLLSIIILGFIGSIIAFGINELIVPPTSLAQEKLLNKGKLVSKHFTFVDKTDKEELKQVMLIGYFDGSNTKKVQIIDFHPIVGGKTAISDIYTANAAKWDKEHIILKDGISYKITPDGIFEKTDIFKNKLVQTNRKAYQLLVKSLKKAKNMSITEINEYISLLIDSHHSDEARYYQVRLQQKFSQPLATIILGLVGLILGIHPPRSSRFLGYTVGMFVILLYYFVWPLSMALGNIGVLPPFFAAWLPNILAIIIGLSILKYKDF